MQRQRAGAEDEEMISLRLAIPAVLVAAAVAGCITYFVTLAPPQSVEADQRLPLTLPNVTGRADSGISTNIRHPTTDEHIDAFERAAEAILKRAQNAKASADKPLVTGHIPLPKPRPILRP
jgi:hypothetical protein